MSPSYLEKYGYGIILNGYKIIPINPPNSQIYFRTKKVRPAKAPKTKAQHPNLKLDRTIDH
jgi:hypothetical protein